jgi:predicted dehydrogenase
MLKVGVIGYGYWGPNIVRNFQAHPECEVVIICDKDVHQLVRANKAFPHTKKTEDFFEVIRGSNVDLVAVITPVSTHFELVKEALEERKQIFVAKPFTRTSTEAKSLIDLAFKYNLKIMVDHTFLFTGAVQKIKELINNEQLGRIYYYDSIRVNLGLFQRDVNVIWDLAPHDFSIMDYVIDSSPYALSAQGIAHFTENQDVAYVTAYFPNKLIAHFAFNWLSPVKLRRTIIGGSREMLIWDDLETDEKIKLYDKGVIVETREDLYNLLIAYRKGSMCSPLVDHREALQLEIEHFVDAIQNKIPLKSDCQMGLRVVELLEACDKSINSNGKVINLSTN